MFTEMRLGIPLNLRQWFYMQRNVLTATWKNGDYYDTYTPPFVAEVTSNT
jgi:hypothetical protein